MLRKQNWSGFFSHYIRAPVIKFYFFLNYVIGLNGSREKKKKGSFALYVAMLTSKRFAFMFKPLPVKSKTKRKQNHTDTQNHTVITTQFEKNQRRPFCLLFRCFIKLVSNIWFYLLDPTNFDFPPIARATYGTFTSQFSLCERLCPENSDKKLLA